MQDPNTDTEYRNDILQKKGILPSKDNLRELEKETEEEEQQIFQQSIMKTFEDMALQEQEDTEHELNEEDEHANEMYRQQRLAEWKITKLKNKFGQVLEISGDIMTQFIEPLVYGGMNLTKDELEWKLSEPETTKTELEENPKKPAEDTLLSSVQCLVPMKSCSDSEDD